jgi:hypothetical protein
MSINEVKGDLFTGPMPYVHCVSKDFKMGAGIAKIFRDKYGSMEYLIGQNKQIGEVAILRIEEGFVFYLVTKEHYYDKPTYKSMENSLKSLHRILVLNDIDSISIPKIGCGLDKLDWEKVKLLIHKCLIGIKVTVYVI